MKKWLWKITLVILSILSVVGINIRPSHAAHIPQKSHIMEVKENTPLFLQHSADLFYLGAQENPLLTWHYSHYSHESHYSHYSHGSHYSGY